jgi:hypothetical protein
MKDLKIFIKDLEKEFDSIEVGIFDKKKHKSAKDKDSGLKIFAGGSARKIGKNSDKSNSEILEKLDKSFKILQDPIAKTNATEYKNFIESVLVNKKDFEKNKNKISNAFKALFIAPILKQKYGRNSKKTAENKGFNRFLIDTGQVLKNIKVKINDTIL